MNSHQISSYWQAYLDLIELWAKGVWDEADMVSHFLDHGKMEGRRVADLEQAPADWSDWHYFSNSVDSYQWWWRKGIIETGLNSALIEGDAAMQRGCIARDTHIQKTASMSQNALEQLVENAKDHVGIGPLAAIDREKFRWGGQNTIGLLPLTEALKSKYSEEYGYIIVLPWLESGGAELVGLWHYLAAKELGLRPLIVLGDKPDITQRFLDQNLDVLNLPDFFKEATGNNFDGLTKEARAEVLTTALEVIQPETLHLIHSFAGYIALSTKPTKARLRAACETIYVSAFCPHIHAPGNYDGYFRFIPEIEDVVDMFVFDNDWYMQEMAKMYQVFPEKMTAIKYPIDAVAPVKRKAVDRPKVLWASRFDSQKNPQIVGDIARQLPELDFVMFGRRVLDDLAINWDQMPGNVSDGGEFFKMDDLPIAECIAFLYTSKFDGTPNILMEIASCGLPIVTPNIGGIAGFLGDGWPAYVAHPEDIDGYVAHLSSINNNTNFARTLVDIQKKKLLDERSYSAFLNAVQQLQI